MMIVSPFDNSQSFSDECVTVEGHFKNFPFNQDFPKENQNGGRKRSSF